MTTIFKTVTVASRARQYCEMTKYLVFFALVVGLPRAIKSIDADCDFSQTLELDTEYYVYNTEFPKNYSGARSCRWYAESTTKINLNCQIFSLPASTNCAGDRLAISPSGDPDLNDARNYCGTGTFEVTSDADSINIVFTSYADTRGGRFLCTLQAVSTPTPPPCFCGYKGKQSRIVGGTETGVNEFPMMAGIVNLEKKVLQCGGTIISEKHVMTAAHCVYKLKASQVAILVGDHDISTDSDTSASRLYFVSYIAIHPGYRKQSEDKNDIAILTTKDTIVFSMNVGPACLPFRYADATFVGKKVQALGWGTLSFGGSRPNTLQKVTLDVTSLRNCEKYHSRVTRKEFCTYTPGKDACQFDSGGPILYQSSESSRVFGIGIISYGRTCADQAPGVNTRVGAFLDWIVSVTPGVNYCVAQ